MNRRLVASFLVLVVAGVLALWLFVGREVPPTALVDERSASVEASAVAASAELDAEAQAPIDSRAALPGALASAPGSAAPAASASRSPAKAARDARAVRDEERTLRGTLVVVDPGGGMHSSESGTFLLDQRQGAPLSGGGVTERAPPPQVVQVEQGRWSANVRRGLATLRVLQFELDGRAARLDPERDRVDVPDDGELALSVRWLPTSLLHVRAADTGAELSDVELDLNGITRMQGNGSMYDKRVLERSTSSPIEIVPTGDMLFGKTVTLSVRAYGYAWGTIDLDLVQGGERVLTLVPGGTLRVQTVGEVAKEGARSVRLREIGKDSGLPFVDRQLGGEVELKLDSIPARAFQVSVEIGAWAMMPDVLARREVEVLAGQTTTVVLELQEPTAGELVPVGGLLVIAPEWKVDDGFTLRLFPIAINDVARGHYQLQAELPGKDMHRRDGRANTFEWSVAKLWPGKYEVSVSELSFATTIDVEPPGATKLLIEVPAPAQVRVRTIDKDSNAPAPISKLLFRMQRDEGTGAAGVSTPASSSIAVQAGIFDFRVVPGKIAVSPQTDGFASTWTTFDVQAGTNDLELPVVRSLGFVMTLADRDAIVPWGNRRPKARQIDGQGKSIGWGPSDHGQKITVNAPGTYRVQIPPLDGFLPVPDQEVIVEAGKFTEHMIVLERAP